MIISTKHPITARLHGMFGVKEDFAGMQRAFEDPKFMGENRNKAILLHHIAKVFMDIINRPETEADTQQTNFSEVPIPFQIANIASLIDGVFDQTLFEAEHRFNDEVDPTILEAEKQFKGFYALVKMPINNMIALFMGLLLSANNTIKLTKANLHETCNKIKTFMKDLSHMQLDLFFHVLSSFGVDSMQTHCYKFDSSLFNFDEKEISLKEKFFESMKEKIKRYDDGLYKGVAKFFDDDGRPGYIFFNSDQPHQGCPTLFIPVNDNGNRKSFNDVVLDWIQDLVEKKFSPS